MSERGVFFSLFQATFRHRF